MRGENVYSSTDVKLNNILKEITLGVKTLYGEKLKEILLYGSYARGQNDDESDIDLMILVDIDEIRLKKYEKELNDIISDIGFRYMKVLSLVDISYERFNDWIDVVPYYKNVRTEGIIIYEQ